MLVLLLALFFVKVAEIARIVCKTVKHHVAYR
jgi:hypothetical protein